MGGFPSLYSKALPRGHVLRCCPAAVLIEADWLPLVDEVWVVTVSPEVARDRIVHRNGLTPEQANQRIAAQLTNDERTTHADVVISNDGSLEDLERTVDVATELDVIQARARLSEMMQGVEPVLAADGSLELRGARHPLLMAAVRSRVSSDDDSRPLLQLLQISGRGRRTAA